MKKKFTFIIGIILSLLIIAGCVPNTPTQNNGQVTSEKGSFLTKESFNPKADLTLKKFSSEQEFKDFMSQNSQTYAGGIYYARSMLSSVAPSAMVKSVAMDSSAGSGVSENAYSQTNNQVASVDEADLIKTDGDYIYTISQDTLFIVKAYPGNESKIISTIKFNSTKNPQGLFIKGNKLSVFGSFYDKKYFKENNISINNAMTFFESYDITNKETPTLSKEYKFEGNYFQARMTNGYAYIVLLSGMDKRVGPITPLIMKGDEKMYMPVDRISYFPMPYNYPQLLSVHAVNLENTDELNSESLVVEGANQMYMSEKNIYIAQSEYINEWQIRTDITKEIVMAKLDEKENALIQKIKDTDNDVLSQMEKDQKIMQVIYDHINYLDEKEQETLNQEIDDKTQAKMKEYEYVEYTIISKISVDKGNIKVLGNGKIPGHLNNQFSMDEKDDVLRVASTISQRWPIMPMYTKTSAEYIEPKPVESENHIYTFNKEMNIIGSLKGLGKSEQIYSTRFIGDRLYMVTFKQVDPFFVIDLSDPKDIKELGQLKIPGFSRYLHPYDENTLIGIGRDATELGRTQGLKISLFDVTDTENPKEIAKFVTDEKYASSVAEYEHKAFLFNKEKELLVIPAYSYTYTWDGYKGSSKEDYNGAMVFKINKNEITLRGIIDHSQSNPYYYGSMVERSLFINEMLYTKSLGLLRVNKIDDLTSVNKIELKSESKNSYVVY